MTYQRLDRGCTAKILAILDDRVMLTASWLASETDHRRFNVMSGVAYNTTTVSKSYFERKYGVAL